MSERKRRREVINDLELIKRSVADKGLRASLTYAIESIKVDMVYELMHEKIDFIEIPNEATNKDVIKEVFPSAYETDHFILNSPLGNIVYIRLCEYQEMRVQEDWLNEPYKKEDKK